MAITSMVSSIETYLPEKILTNDDLSKIVDTNNEWIVSRTGIEYRHIVAENECNYDIAYKAAIKCLQNEKISADDIDCIIVATTTSYDQCPATAVKVQSLLGAKSAFAFDIQAACSGFIYGLSIADSFIKSQTAKKILLIGSDVMSQVADWNDRSTCILLGDGAGACIVKPYYESRSDDQLPHKLIDTCLFSDGDKYDNIMIHHSANNKHMGHITMKGQEVFKNAIKCMSESMEVILKKNNMSIDDIDWIIPHQANARIIKSLCELNNYPIEKAIISIQEHANTSSATIPLAIKYGMDHNKIKSGDTLLLTAFGAGFTWGSAILRI